MFWFVRLSRQLLPAPNAPLEHHQLQKVLGGLRLDRPLRAVARPPDYCFLPQDEFTDEVEQLLAHLS